MSSMQVPVGWTVTLYDGDNFKGNSIVYTTSEHNFPLDNRPWNDRMVSIKIVAGTAAYPILNGTYQLVNRRTGLAAGAITDADSGDLDRAPERFRKRVGDVLQSGDFVLPEPYHQGAGQLWRVEAQVNGQFRLLNLENDLALEVPRDFPWLGAPIVTGTYVPVPDLATGGLGLSSGTASSHPAALAFDGLPGTYWATASVPSAANPVWLEYQYPSGGNQLVTGYSVTSGPNAQTLDPTAWQFQGSADGTTWVTLDTQFAQAFTARGEAKSYPLDNSVAYRYYRLGINQSGGLLGVQVAELGLYSKFSGDRNQRWTILPAAGTDPGSFFHLRNAGTGGALDVCATPLPGIKYVCQWVVRLSELEQWTLRVP